MRSRSEADSRALVIGLVFETFESYPHDPDAPQDQHAEFEPESTIAAMEAAIRALGHAPRRLGSPRTLLEACASRAGSLRGVDVVWSIAEGQGSRNREGWAPTLLEMVGLPVLGSDALTLSTSLDKLWCNRAMAAAGIPIAPQCQLGSADEAIDAHLPADFPLFVKPRWEGTAKGIRLASKVGDRAALAREVGRVARDYGQPALVEAFLPGAEYTVCLVGSDPVRALPVMQRALEAESGIGLHAVEGDGRGGLQHRLPGELDAALEARLQALAIRSFEALECRDFARVDFKLDAAGEPVFLEINPLPTFAVDGSFAILAELEGRPYPALLAEVLEVALRRHLSRTS